MAQLYFYYSSMNAGKSTSLLQSAYNYEESGMKTLLYTAAIDDRYETGKISSRIGLESTARLFDIRTNLFTEVKKQHQTEPLSCILIDEAQFLTKNQVNELAKVVDNLDIPVLCYGIRTDFQGELFPGSQRLLAIADKLTELKTVCHCGKKATMIVRYDNSGKPVIKGEQIHIGGNDTYVPMCRKHFMENFPD